MTHTANQLRQHFLAFFEQYGHTIVPSGPLVPAADPSLLFTNAGMVQFKDFFLGESTAPYQRATTAQKCMRVSGKHNDLEEVGRTTRHHTFFEMLGNFSFGDYFKEQAIRLAWQYIAHELKLPQDKIWITVFGGDDGLAADDEARQLWRKISGLPEARILDKGSADNFWSMGDTGPCGPCTEIYIDQGTGNVTEADFANGRVMEIWNNVFMQFNRQKDGTLINLPAPSVDTGMGLERLSALVQHETSNYHSDLFMPLLANIAQQCKQTYQKSDSDNDMSMRVIADHARATAFLVADGVTPSNDGRGYVMRRIMRRAIRHGKKLNMPEGFFAEVCQNVVQHMQQAYNEVLQAKSLLAKIAESEEEGFRRTLETGLSLLHEAMKHTHNGQLAGDIVFKLYDTYGFPKDLTESITQEHRISIDHASFEALMQQQKQRSRGGSVGDEAVEVIYKQLARSHITTTFLGYTQEDAELTERAGHWRQAQDAAGTTYVELESRVVALLHNQQQVAHAEAGMVVELVLDPTPFYGESGGQVGDIGRVVDAHGLYASVGDSQKPLEGLTVSTATIQHGIVRVGQTVWAGYDVHVRQQTRAHHSATHLLNSALRRVLGDHVKQAGSRVEANRLRFDFTHFAPLTAQELSHIETDVNQHIQQLHNVTTQEMPLAEAKARGVVGLFNEKYGHVVRVVAMGDCIELCGGTHAKSTGALQLMLLERDSSVKSGVRRLEARVADAAIEQARMYWQLIQSVALQLHGRLPIADDFHIQALRSLYQNYTDDVAAIQQHQLHANLFDPQQIPVMMLEAFDAHDYQQCFALRNTWYDFIRIWAMRPQEAQTWLQEQAIDDMGHIVRGTIALRRTVEKNKDVLGTRKHGDIKVLLADIVSHARTIGDITHFHAHVDVDNAMLRKLASKLLEASPSCVIALGGIQAEQATLLIAVSPKLTARFHANTLLQSALSYIDGKGGGKADFAQAGGKKVAGLHEALEMIAHQLTQHGTMIT